MKAKYKIDGDTRTLILKYIRKYDEYLLWYQTERDRIIQPSHELGNVPPSKNKNPQDSTLRAVVALERLDKNHRVQVIKAIDHAKLNIGLDIPSDTEIVKLRNAVWLSCLNGREYNFDAFAGLISCERRQFYYYKNAFLNDIKYYLGL